MKNLFSGLLLALSVAANAQPILTSWKFNQNGDLASYWAQTGTVGNPSWTYTNTTDSADVLQVCWTATQVYVRSNGMTDNMGKYLNPGTCKSQHFIHRFTRTPKEAATKSISPKVGDIGLLVNGLSVYGLGNASSWNGSSNVPMGPGVWNVEVGKSEGFTLDTAFGAHPQQQGAYHTHLTAFRLYKNVDATKHSPIIGFAFDGFPIYGPFGYTEPMNPSSPVGRMKSGYSLRNITDRTTLPYGVTASQAGPPVNATYPIGTYCEDWEWLASNGGDLDKYNGRLCVTPEYPQGTYAYFTTTDAAGKGVFPYYIGIEYYGEPDKANYPMGPNGNTVSIPSGATCATQTITATDEVLTGKKVEIFPNPARDGQFTVFFDENRFEKMDVLNGLGRVVISKKIEPGAGKAVVETRGVAAVGQGVFFVKLWERGGGFVARKVVVTD